MESFFFSPSTMATCTTGSSSPGCPSWSFRIRNTLLHHLLAFRVSNKKPTIIVMGFPLYVTDIFLL